MKNKFITYTIQFGLAVFLLSGCKKDKADEPAAATEQNLALHIHSNVGIHEANFDSTFQTTSGRNFTIEDYRMYISNIILIKNDGSEFPITGKVILTNPATDEYDLGKVPVGNYKGFRFQIGLDSIINRTDPSIYPSSDPLSVQTPSIHWSWNSGYIFWKVEGKVDTTVAQNGPVNVDYLYHIGTDALKRQIDFSTSAFTVISGQDQIVHLEFDLLAALSNVDMTSELICHTTDNPSTALKIANNWQAAFHIE